MAHSGTSSPMLAVNGRLCKEWDGYLPETIDRWAISGRNRKIDFERPPSMGWGRAIADTIRALQLQPKLSPQQILDMSNACILTESWKRKRGGPSSDGIDGYMKNLGFRKHKEEDRANSIQDYVKGLTFRQQQAVLQRNINYQVIRMLTAVNDVQEDEDILRNARLELESMVNGQDVVSPRGRSLPNFYEIHSKLLGDALRDADGKYGVGFSLRQRTSSVAGAGDGLFVKGAVDPGGVVSLYPGTVYTPEYLLKSGELDALLGSDERMTVVSRVDGVIVDGKHDDASRSHPYAQGQLVNHPPPGVAPNVHAAPYHFPHTTGDSESSGAFPEHLLGLVPNQLAAPLSSLEVLRYIGVRVPTIVLIATRAIEDGEEIFLNYRLNPNAKTPPAWYTAVDAEEDARRWFNPNAPPPAAGQQEQQ